MTFGFGLGAGLKALSAARLGIQTAGHNVANANTPGFSRQRVLLASSQPFFIGAGLQMGTGVDVDSIGRVVDRSLSSRVNLQIGILSSAELEFNRMSEVEGLFGEPDNGLSGGLADLFGSFGALQSDPADAALRGGAVQSAASLADSLNLLRSRLGNVADSTSAEVRTLTDQLNTKARRIAAINSQIGAVEASGAIANDLRDQRDLLAQEIAGIADVRAVERSTGSLDILIGGHLLVSGDRTSPVSVRDNAAGRPTVYGSSQALNISSGQLGSLLNRGTGAIDGLISRLDGMARNMALEFNRVHSTGVPASGPFRTLTASLGVEDTDFDGTRGDELLNRTGLPFDIVEGDLYVNVTNQSTGDIVRTRVAIDPAAMTLNDLAAAIDSIDNLAANVDPTGRLRVQAVSGHAFDFSPRLDQNPNTFGAFGGTNPTLGSGGQGPFDLSTATFPQTFTVDVDGTLESVTLNQSDFVTIGAVTADELAAAINDDLTNATAQSEGGRLVIRSNAAGSTAQLQMIDGAGSPLSAVGMALGPATGQAQGVNVELSGAYTGADNRVLSFVPDADGEIGVTAGLTVGVFDQNGVRVGTLDVGDQYNGEPLEVGDGIQVSFSQGTISSTNNQAVGFDALADSDTSDVLAALGLNTLFVGDTADTLAVDPRLLANSDAFASSLTSAEGDGGNIERLLGIRDLDFEGLGDTSIENFYGDVVTSLGFDVQAAETTVRAEYTLMAHVQQQRDAVSGVNIDEEMVDIVRHQQAFEAAARFVSTVQEMTSTLINLGR